MFVPYSYQDECLDAIDAVQDQGLTKALIVMASGLGKTVTMAFSAKRWRQRRGKGRVLFLCHNNDILYQSKTTFQAVNGLDHSYGYLNGEEKHLHYVDFLFASFQTMEQARDLFDPTEFAYVIVDESHHSQADTFRSTIEYFRPQFLLGATATPDRLDMRDIRELFGQEIFYLPLEEALAKGLLTPVDYRLLTDEIVLRQRLEMDDGGRVSLAELNRTIFVPRRDEEIAKIVARHTSELNNPRVMFFCTSIKHCEHLAKYIADSFAIHSRIPGKERAVKLEMFRQGLIGTVLVVDAFNEGIDIPQANVVVFLRSTTSRTVFLQQLGRGLRLSEGKDKVIVLDFVANCERIKMVHSLWRRVDDLLPPPDRAGRAENGTSSPMMLNINTVEFQETIVPLLRLMDRVRPNFYPTWQEASAAAIEAGVTTKKEYRKRRVIDARLPSAPDDFYADFPDWPVFLASDHRAHVKDPYPNWQEASVAAIALGVTSGWNYRQKYKGDPRLPSQPRGHYADFPGWNMFLGKEERTSARDNGQNASNGRNPYPNWQKAAEVVREKGIKSMTEYRARRAEDPKLPIDPRRYKGFPGWKVFLDVPN